MDNIKIVSLNCRGLNGCHKRNEVLKFLKEKQYQFFCLQDTHFTETQQRMIYLQWNGESYCSFGTSSSRGVAILFKKNIEYKVHKVISDNDGNFLILDLTIQTKRLTLVNLYGPNKDKPEFFENVFEKIAKIGNLSYIICGDFNLIQDEKLDCYNYKKINNPNARKLV